MQPGMWQDGNDRYLSPILRGSVEAVMALLGPAHEAAVLEEEVREESVPKLSRHTPQAGSSSSQDELGFRGNYYNFQICVMFISLSYKPKNHLLKKSQL